jgi:hypothetical protein
MASISLALVESLLITEDDSEIAEVSEEMIPAIVIVGIRNSPNIRQAIGNRG